MTREQLADLFQRTIETMDSWSDRRDYCLRKHWGEPRISTDPTNCSACGDRITEGYAKIEDMWERLVAGGYRPGMFEVSV